MDDKTSSLIIMVGALLMVFGAVVELHSLRHYRSERAPSSIPSWNPKDWRVRDYWFTEPRGYQLFRRGESLMSIGATIGLVFSAIMIF